MSTKENKYDKFNPVRTAGNVTKEVRPENQIQALYDSIGDDLQNAVKKYIAIGGILNKQKQSLEHGQFTEWVRTSNLPFDERQARKYMRVFEHTQNGIQNSVFEIEGQSLDTIDRIIRTEIKNSKGNTDQPKSSISREAKQEIQKLEMNIKQWQGLIKEAKSKIRKLQK